MFQKIEKKQKQKQKLKASAVENQTSKKQTRETEVPKMAIKEKKRK
jgi:hypothetical protein